MNRDKKKPAGGQPSGHTATTEHAAGRLMSSTPLYTLEAGPVNTSLRELRQAYNLAILEERWGDALEYQEQYHAVEIERKNALLHRVIALLERNQREVKQRIAELERAMGAVG